MKTRNGVLACALIGLAGLAGAAPAEPGDPERSGVTEKRGQLWVNVGGFSRHFARNKNYNESNLGLGIEYRINPEVSVMAGTYYNSVRRTTTYGAVNWQPLSLGDWKIGAMVGVMNGYPAVKRGGTFFAAVPMATYEGTRFGLNVGIIPTTSQVDGALVLQFKVRAY